MRVLNTEEIIEPLAEAIENALMNVESATVEKLKEAAEKESGERAKWAIERLIENSEVARNTRSFACQDTGLAVVFAEVGQRLKLEGKLLSDAINEGVRRGYKTARKSVACPLSRVNTKDNTPAVIHTQIVEGDKLSLYYLAKGAGSENTSRLYMLTPSKGREGIIASVVDAVKQAGANPCPPIILGVGIGGTMEKAALLSKKALLRECGRASDDKEAAALEKDILSAVNALKIGAQGFGGDTTALSAAVEIFPTHIGMLPVAVNIQCHSSRHAHLVFEGKEIAE